MRTMRKSLDQYRPLLSQKDVPCLDYPTRSLRTAESAGQALLPSSAPGTSLNTVKSLHSEFSSSDTFKFRLTEPRHPERILTGAGGAPCGGGVGRHREHDFTKLVLLGGAHPQVRLGVRVYHAHVITGEVRGALQMDTEELSEVCREMPACKSRAAKVDTVQ
jgi:hypothetical protein